jgi:hypothetical protein
MFTHGTRNRPRDRGREETVFEVHYCFEDPENDFARLTELHDAFTSAFVRMTSPDVLSASFSMVSRATFELKAQRVFRATCSDH